MPGAVGARWRTAHPPPLEGRREVKPLMGDSTVGKILVSTMANKLSNQCMYKAIVSGTEGMTHPDSRRP